MQNSIDNPPKSPPGAQHPPTKVEGDDYWHCYKCSKRFLGYGGECPQCGYQHKIAFSLSEHSALLSQAAAEARAEGEKVGRLKEQIESLAFTSTNPAEHYSIRSRATDRRKELLVELMRLNRTPEGGKEE